MNKKDWFPCLKRVLPFAWGEDKYGNVLIGEIVIKLVELPTNRKEMLRTIKRFCKLRLQSFYERKEKKCE